jgi:hypothetical protein
LAAVFISGRSQCPIVVPWQTVRPGPKSPSKLRTIGPPVVPPVVVELPPVVVPEPVPLVLEPPLVLPEPLPVVLEPPPVLLEPALVLPDAPLLLLTEPPLVVLELPAELVHPTSANPMRSAPKQPTRLVALRIMLKSRPWQPRNGN